LLELPEEQELPPPVVSTSPKSSRIRRKSSFRPEALPHVDIQSRVKYFEGEIAKEHEGVLKNRKQSADLLKSYQKPNERTWGRSGHSKYFRGGKSCGAFSCRGAAEACRGQVQDSPAPAPPQVVKVQGRPVEPSSGKEDENGQSSDYDSMGIRKGDAGRKGSRDESTSTSPSSMTAAAINSQALILSKELPGNELEEVTTEGAYRQELAESAARRKLTVVKFYAPWCRPCQRMDPIWIQLVDAHPDVKFLQVNVDLVGVENILEELDVGHIPSFFLFRDAAPVGKIEGETEKVDLEKMIRKHK